MKLSSYWGNPVFRDVLKGLDQSISTGYPQNSHRVIPLAINRQRQALCSHVYY